MNLSLAVILIVGLLFNDMFKNIRLPGLLGMIIVGIIIGPFSLNIIDQELMVISGELRRLALITILLRAGLGINKEIIKKVGVPAVKMSVIPGVIEGSFILLSSHFLLGLTWAEAGMLGFIVGAVSPAVVVPSMLRLQEQRLGEDKGIPTLIIAGASVDDVVAITLFTVFLNMGMGQNISLGMSLGVVPFKIIGGIVIGAALGYIYTRFVTHAKYHLRDTKKVLLLIATAILLNQSEEIIPTASLLGVMMLGFMILEMAPDLSQRLSMKLNKVWIFAEIMLFVLIGSAVNIKVAIHAGTIGILIICIGLIGRSIGVLISLYGSGLNVKEKLFCIVAYMPKATVQAAIGAVPLAMGIEAGELILAIAVMAIILTAPLGSIGISFLAPKLLKEGVKIP